jgi:hypothetical protein
MKIIYFYSILFCLMSSAQDSKVNHYKFNDFVAGKVLMSDGTSYNRLLNYNKLTQEIVFKQGNDLLAISSFDIVDTVFVKSAKFVKLNNDFLELLYVSDYDLFVNNYCKAYEDGPKDSYGVSTNNSSVNTVDTYRGNSSLYRKLDLGKEIKLTSHKDYYIRKDGVVNKFKSFRQLSKLYPLKKKIIKKYIKENKLNYNNETEVLNLVLFIES